MPNQKLASIFFEMADLLELSGVDWKPQAYRKAARSLLESKSVNAVHKSGGTKALDEIPSVGEGIAKKIAEFIETGQVKELSKIKASLPKGLQQMLSLISLGPKKVMKLYRILKVTNLQELEKAAKAHKIASLHGFGEKSEAEILESIKLAKLSPGRLPYAEALKLANALKRKIEPFCEKVIVAGSIRHKKETIGDIDILAIAKDSSKAMDAFRKAGAKTLSTGSTKTMIILKNGFQADLRVVKPESFGAALLYFTGPVSFNIEVRKIAISKGYKLSEYGLFDRKTGKLIASKDEESIFKKLGLKYVKPEDRKQ